MANWIVADGKKKNAFSISLENNWFDLFCGGEGLPAVSLRYGYGDVDLLRIGLTKQELFKLKNALPKLLEGTRYGQRSFSLRDKVDVAALDKRELLDEDETRILTYFFDSLRTKKLTLVFVD